MTTPLLVHINTRTILACAFAFVNTLQTSANEQAETFSFHLPSAEEIEASKAAQDTMELDAFVVYGGAIEVIDGPSGESYHRANEVVKEFRAEFNEILLQYHKMVLINELRTAKRYLKMKTILEEEYNRLAKLLDFPAVSMNLGKPRGRENNILSRLYKDPFFRINAVVVWHLEDLTDYTEERPSTGNWRDIRHNPETYNWERRVTTEWVVRSGSQTIIKEQGLELDGNRGYHLINQDLPYSVSSKDFQEVHITYPIIVNQLEPTEDQVKRLKETFLQNLTYIYDPFSWKVRRNEMFRGGFQRRILRSLSDADYSLSDRKWFDAVLSYLVDDIGTIKVSGVREIYDYNMLQRVPSNKHKLGIELDPLEWNPDEKREFGNDGRSSQSQIRINFNTPSGARFIVLDAYRRFGDTFVQAIKSNLEAIPKGSTVSGKELIKRSIQQTSNFPADKYIKLATAAQIQELEKCRHN